MPRDVETAQNERESLTSIELLLLLDCAKRRLANIRDAGGHGGPYPALVEKLEQLAGVAEND